MDDIRTVLARRKRQDFLFNLVGIGCTLVGIVTLGALLLDLALAGVARLDWQFLTSFPHGGPPRQGYSRRGWARSWSCLSPR